MALIDTAARFAPELIDNAWRAALQRVAKEPELLRIAKMFGDEVPEGLIPAQTISRGEITPAQAAAFLRIRRDTGVDFPDFAKDVANKAAGRTRSISTLFQDAPSGTNSFFDDGTVLVSKKDTDAMNKLIKEMTQGSLIARDVTEPITAYRTYDDFFGYKPSTTGVLSFTETPEQMASRWTGGNRLSWQPTRIDPADITYDYGIAAAARPEETEIQALAKLVSPIGPRLSLSEVIAQGLK